MKYLKKLLVLIICLSIAVIPVDYGYADGINSQWDIDLLSIDENGHLEWKTDNISRCRIMIGSQNSINDRYYSGDEINNININDFIEELIENGQLEYRYDYRLAIGAWNTDGNIVLDGADKYYYAPAADLNTVNSIQFEPSSITVTENTNGNWQTVSGYDSEVYIYDIYSLINVEGNQIIVNDNDVYTYGEIYKEGSYWSGFFNESGESVYVNASTTQYDEPWLPGGTYPVTLEYMGKTCDISVTVVSGSSHEDEDIIEIGFEPAEPLVVYEEGDGYWEEVMEYDEEGNEIGTREVFIYYLPSIHEEGNRLTVTTDEGTEEYVYHEWDGEVYFDYGFYDQNDVLVYDEGYLTTSSYQTETPWTVGGDNYMIVNLNESYCFVPVTVLVNPVQSIEVVSGSGFSMIENTGGYEDWSEYYDEETDSWISENYYYYDFYEEFFSEETAIIINGDEIFEYNYDRDFVNSNGELLTEKYGDLYLRNDQSINHWTLGDDNHFTVELLGKTYECTISIVENPVQSISFELAEPLVIYEESDGNWEIITEYDEYGEVINERDQFIYNIPTPSREGNKLIVTTNDGVEEYTYHGWSSHFYESGYYDSDNNYAFDESEILLSHNQYDEPWTVGGTYSFTLYYMERTTEIPVSIVENPVKSIEFIPANEITLMENMGGDYHTREVYDEATDTWVTEEYFNYYEHFGQVYSDGNKVIVNGDEVFVCGWDNVSGGQEFFNSDGESLSSIYDHLATSDDQWENPWTVGTNYFTISLLGIPYKCPVTITENPVKSIEFVPSEALYVYEGDVDPDSGEYNIDAMRIALKDGNKIIVNGTDEYICGRYKATDYPTYSYFYMNSEGTMLSNVDLGFYSRDNDGDPEFCVEYMGQRCSVPISVVNNPIDSITYVQTSVKELYEGTGDIYSLYSLYDKSSDGDKLVISMKDGEVREYTLGYHIRKDDNGYNRVYRDFCCGDDYIDIYDIRQADQIDEDDWTAPGQYQVDYMYKGIVFPVTFSYVENNIEGIQFEPAHPLEYYEYTGGFWDYDYETGSRFYYYSIPMFDSDGNSLTITYTNGVSVEYVYYNNFFRDENGNKLDGMLEYFYDQNENHWTLGSDNYLKVEYKEFTDSVPVTIVENNIESIEYIPVGPWEWYTNTGEDIADNYWSWFKNGDVIRITKTDGTDDIYTFKYANGFPAKGFVNDEGRVLSIYGDIAVQTGEGGWDIFVFGQKAGSGEFVAKEDNVKSVHVDVKNPVNVKDYDYDGFVSEDGVEYVESYWSGRRGDRGDYQEYAIFTEGDTITITDNNDNETVYTFRQDKNLYGFYDASGYELSFEFLRFADNGYFDLFNAENDDRYFASNKTNEIYVYYLGHKAEESIRVTLGEDEEQLAAPVISAELNANGKPVISWDPVDGAAKYDLLKATSPDGPYTRLILTVKNQITHTGAVDGTTYYYKAMSVDADGNTSDDSNVVSITPVKPLAAPEVTASLNANGKPVLSWDPVDGASKYEVFRANSADGTYTRLILTVKNQITHTGAVDGSTYYYKVRSVDADGNTSDYGNTVSITAAKPLEAPTVTASLNASGKPVLSWDAVDGASKYEVFRANSEDGTYTRLILTVKTQITHTGAVDGNTYFYKVRSVDADGNTSDYGNTVSITAGQAMAAPAISVSLNSNGKPVISWDPVDGAAKYDLWKTTSPDGPYTRLILTVKNQITHTGAVDGTTYYYKAMSVDANGNTSDYGNVVSITAGEGLAAPTVKVSLNSSGKPVLSWDAVPGAAKYDVYKATSPDGTYSRLILTVKNQITHTGAVDGNTYYYKVKSVDAEGNTSDYGNVVSITAGEQLAPPTVTASLNASGKPVLTWDAVPGAAKYDVYKATSPDGQYTRLILTVKTQITHTGAVAGNTYYYKVMSVDANGNTSDYGNVINVTV